MMENLTNSGIDSPSHDSLKNVEGCYSKNIFRTNTFANSRRALQSGAEKITKTFRSVRNTFGNLSQVRVLKISCHGILVFFLCVTS